MSVSGDLQRVSTVARRSVSTSTVDYEKRRQLDVSAKSGIAERAAALIPEGCSVAINIGTTTELVADALKYHKDLTVITNNINVVHILRTARMKSLIIVGGEVRTSDGAIIGSDALEAFRNYKVDYAVIGASSLDVDGSVLDFDQREVAVARAILKMREPAFWSAINPNSTFLHRIASARHLIWITLSPMGRRHPSLIPLYPLDIPPSS